MAEGLNRVFLQGNLTRDPELRSTQGGASVLKIGMATNERYKKGDEWVERTEFHSVDIWGARAEALERILRKGSRVLIEGSLTTESWDDKESGKKQYRTSIRAQNVILLDGKREERDDGDDRSRSDDRSRGRDDRSDDRRDRRGGRDDDRRDDRGRDGSRSRDDDGGRSRDGRGGFE